MRKKISLIGLVSCGYTAHEIHRNRKDHLSAEALRTPKIGSLVDGNLADFIAVDRDHWQYLITNSSASMLLEP